MKTLKIILCLALCFELALFGDLSRRVRSLAREAAALREPDETQHHKKWNLTWTMITNSAATNITIWYATSLDGTNWKTNSSQVVTTVVYQVFPWHK